MQRLDKFLSDAKVASRKELKQIIRSGRVTVDGKIITSEDTKLDERTAAVVVDGIPVYAKQPITIVLNKPAGYLTATEDKRDKTIMELIPDAYRRMDVVPVGRLDKATEGLLLLTNDGQLNHRLSSPKHGIWKTYYAEHEGEATAEDIEAFRKGIVLSDGLHCLPAELIVKDRGKSLIRVQEGKFHQVRRMMDSRALHVTYLKRVSEGSLTPGDLSTGQCRELTAAEIEQLEKGNYEVCL